MTTTGKCSRCGKIHPTNKLMLLPETEAYERAVAKSLLGGPKPAPLDEEVLRAKYGYDSTDLFCEDCLTALMLDKE